MRRRKKLRRIRMKKEKGKMVIGTNALNNQPVTLTSKDMNSHMHILGTTGAGKSKEMEDMMRYHISNGDGICLLDPHGDVYKNMLDYVTLKQMGRKVILIDPNDEDWAVGINYLEYDPKLRSSTSHASEVMKGIAKVFGGEDTDIMPRLQRWERNALIPLIERKFTVVELSQIVDPERSFVRKLILEEVENYEVLDEWDRFEQAPRRDKESYVEAVLNRANKFTIGRNIRRIFCQTKSTVDFRKAMDEGKIILCNLACNKLSYEEQRMLGIVIIDKIVQAGKSRVDIPERSRRPFYFYLDEFGQFVVSEDISIALQELRKFGVSFILAHQELEQLRQDSRKVYSAVISEPQVKMSFRISREDAEIMVGEFFTGMIRGDNEKRRISQTKFRPKETTRVIETESDSSTMMESETRNPLSPSGPITNTGYTQTSGFTRGVVPFYEYIPFKEDTSIEDYSIEEMTEKFIAWIKNQPNRHAQVKIGQRAPIPIITKYVKSATVRARDVQKLKEEVYGQYALPAYEVDRMIEERRRKFLAEAEALGLVEPMKTTPQLTPESMRHKIPNIKPE
jgi:hypothetical protein